MALEHSVQKRDLTSVDLNQVLVRQFGIDSNTATLTFTTSFILFQTVGYTSAGKKKIS